MKAVIYVLLATLIFS